MTVIIKLVLQIRGHAMNTLIFHERLAGFELKVRERDRNPFPKSLHCRHFEKGYLFVACRTTDEHPVLLPGIMPVKIVTVKPSWNPALRKELEDKRLLIISKDEVLLSAYSQVSDLDGAAVDMVVLVFCSTVDQIKRALPIIIEHPRK